MLTMASRGVSTPQSAIDDGSFLEFATPRIVVEFVADHPEFFFDGNYWDMPYASIAYSHAAAKEEAQARTLAFYRALLSDVMWLAEADTSDLQRASRARLLRAALAMDLLAPTVGDEELT